MRESVVSICLAVVVGGALLTMALYHEDKPVTVSGVLAQRDPKVPGEEELPMYYLPGRIFLRGRDYRPEDVGRLIEVKGRLTTVCVTERYCHPAVDLQDF